MAQTVVTLDNDQQKENFFKAVEADSAHWPNQSVLTIIGTLRDLRQPVSASSIARICNRADPSFRYPAPEIGRGSPVAQNKTVEIQTYLIRMLGKAIENGEASPEQKALFLANIKDKSWGHGIGGAADSVINRLSETQEPLSLSLIHKSCEDLIRGKAERVEVERILTKEFKTQVGAGRSVG